MGNTKRYDAVIIGAGHNGLTTAGYLARAGYSVKVVEKRGIVGGACITEEFYPGFRNSVCAYVVGLLNPEVIAGLELYKYGLEILARPVTALAPDLDGRFAYLEPLDPEKTIKYTRRLSENDANALEHIDKLFAEAAEVLRSIVLETPPNLGGGLSDIWRAGKVANRVRKLSPKTQREVAKLMTMSTSDYLNQWLEHDLVKAAMGFFSIVGNMGSVNSPGSAYVMMHHYFGETHGQKSVWGHAVGGMGSITQAMVKSAQAHGADVQVNAGVKEIILENGVARGVELEDGTTIRARVVASNVHVKLLFEKLIGYENIDEDFAFQVRNFRTRSGSFRMNVALNGMPAWTCLKDEPDGEELMAGSIYIAPSLQYMEQALHEAMTVGVCENPVIEILMPSQYDDTLAPHGQHVMSMFCQHYNPDLPDGTHWDDIKDSVADNIIATIDKYAPGFKDLVVGRQVLSPLDLEREFGLVGGSIFHGDLDFDQLYSLRPVAEYADYRMPIKNLYLCGSSAHPGGGVSGCPGHNAAREIMRDLKAGRTAK